MEELHKEIFENLDNIIRDENGRTKKLVDKKVMRTFRLKLETIAKINAIKEATGQSETEIIEK
jgi:hypothetical protein